MTTAGWRSTLVVSGLSAALFATTITGFSAHPTDIAALRVAAGQVPYRDFWSMYAPGSYTVLAAAFTIFGRSLLISNILGLLTATASVAAYHRVALRMAPGPIAAICALLMAVVFWGTGYHTTFGSYPPASLLFWLAALALARFASRHRRGDLTLAGISLGAAMLFKHDFAGYGCLAAAAALFFTPGLSAADRLRAVVQVAGIVIVIAGVAIGVLYAAGALPDAVRNLIVFPLTDFPYTRPQRFPLVPVLTASAFDSLRDVLLWATCNLPMYAAAIGGLLLWRRRSSLDSGQVTIIVFALAAFPLFWTAAHVQLNTNAISLTTMGMLLLGAGVGAQPLPLHRATRLIGITAALWSAVVLVEPVAKLALSLAQGREWVRLPHLEGIAVTPSDAQWMRGLSKAIEDAAPADAPLQMLSNRNDILLFAESMPYWLSDRTIATAHHELHPGITDTEPVQRRMLTNLTRGPLPVIVREYRFPDAVLESFKTDLATHVSVGSRLIDDWVALHYRAGARFGNYELMNAGAAGEP